jgi:hypothetical protein
MYLNTCFSEQKWEISIPTLFRRSVLLILVVFALSACSTTRGNGDRDYFPGNSPYYSFGTAQSKENFANVKRAESAVGIYSDQRSWGWFDAGIAPGNILMIQYYFPFSVRWELKDGRQFILENIDVRSIMKEYFKDKGNDITLPWQREGRQRDRWDYDPALVYEVKDDTVRLKWLITEIKTPPSQRFLSSGAITKWDLDRKEYLVKEIKGKPTLGIDFNQKWESRNNINRGAVSGK